MYSLNDKIKDLKPYEPIKGDYRIRLDANESYFNLSDDLMQKINDAIKNVNFNRYPDALATDLCQSFADLYNLNINEVVAGNGSDELISILFTAFLMKGQTYAFFERDFSMYSFYGSLSECREIVLKNEEDFSLDVDKCIEICKNEKVDLLIFSNPCNPTSLGVTKEEVLKIVKSLENTLVIADEAYMDFWDQSVLDEINNYDNLLVLKTCSKAVGLASMRVGFAVGNEKLVSAIKAVKSPYNTDTLSQLIATIVLKDKEYCKARFNDIIEATNESVKIFEKLADKHGLELLKSKTNFIVIKTDKSKAIHKYLLENGIAIRAFNDFLRITAGAKEDMLELAKYIDEFLDKKGS